MLTTAIWEYRWSHDQHFEYHPGGAQNAVNPYPLTDAHCTDRAGSNVSLYD